jgi:hypothetical protein
VTAFATAHLVTMAAEQKFEAYQTRKSATSVGREFPIVSGRSTCGPQKTALRRSQNLVDQRYWVQRNLARIAKLGNKQRENTGCASL